MDMREQDGNAENNRDSEADVAHDFPFPKQKREKNWLQGLTLGALS